MTILTYADIPHLTALFLAVVMMLGTALVVVFWIMEQSGQLAWLRTALNQRVTQRQERR